jgi:cell division protein FtsI/penicillin-binding protein 2
VNRALNGAYPPGSTFKPFMALAALMSGKRTPSQAISDPGYFDFGGHHFRDDKAGGHGWWTCTAPSSSPATPTTTCWPTTWAST